MIATKGVHRHNLAQAIFQRNQFAEKGDRSTTRVGDRPRRRSNSVWRCRRMSSQADLHVQRRSHAGCNQARSGGLPFVAVVQTADFRSHHAAAGRLDGASHWRILAAREVRARPLVVRDVGPKNPAKMALIEDDHVVQTLAADRADDAFDVGILPGRARCPNAASKVVSRSWRRNRAFASWGKASRSCCRLHADVGCGVTLTCRIRRRSWARTTKTNRSRQVKVGTAKKSMATVEPR